VQLGTALSASGTALSGMAWPRRRGCGGNVYANWARACCLMLDANLIGQLDELPQIPPLFLVHEPSFGTRKIDGHESVRGEGRTHDQLCLLVFRQWLEHK
jgi:hypothetical protein